MISPIKVLLELRPALDGHSGIPQETRLLFRGLAGLDDVDVIGLIQSSNLVIEPGLRTRDGIEIPARSEQDRIDRLSRLVVSLQQGAASNRLEHYRQKLLRLLGPTFAALKSAMGGVVPLGVFDPAHYRDFIWRGLFAKSLPERDVESVTTRRFRILRWPWSAFSVIGVATGYLGRSLYPRLDTTDIDILLVETPYPGRPKGRTRLVVRYHDAIPLLMPHTIKDRAYHRAAHFQALMRNVQDGAWFACVSEATRRDLISVVPAVTDRAVTIPNMVSHHFHADDSDATRVPEIIWSRKNRHAPNAGGAAVDESDLRGGGLDYLLMVSTIEPRKNHLGLIDAWEKLRSSSRRHLNLVFVGALGWEHQAIVQRATPWLERGGLHFLQNVPADDLRVLYRHARATVCPSFGEGFDFPGVEAMRCGGVVVASDIPVHRDVFQDACEYFSPYAVDELVAAVDAVEHGTARRKELIEMGSRTAQQYLPEHILPQWAEFLHRVAK